MIDQLYQKTILKHAANAIAHGELADADHSLMHHNPMCGDRIKVYIKLENNSLINFSHQAKACALCQASASVLGENYYGLTHAKLTDLIEKIKISLNETTDENKIIWPEDKWQALDVFNVVREHKSRQTCVTLPFDALLLAIEENENSV